LKSQYLSEFLKRNIPVKENLLKNRNISLENEIVQQSRAAENEREVTLELFNNKINELNQTIHNLQLNETSLLTEKSFVAEQFDYVKSKINLKLHEINETRHISPTLCDHWTNERKSGICDDFERQFDDFIMVIDELTFDFTRVVMELENIREEKDQKINLKSSSKIINNEAQNERDKVEVEERIMHLKTQLINYKIELDGLLNVQNLAEEERIALMEKMEVTKAMRLRKSKIISQRTALKDA
jgi:hypothetical protein